jgi:hypothetical protein
MSMILPYMGKGTVTVGVQREFPSYYGCLKSQWHIWHGQGYDMWYENTCYKYFSCWRSILWMVDHL